jgi:TatD DNase family protein
MYIDSHAHLEGEQYDADREAVLRRAREAGVQAILAIGNGTDPASLRCAIPFAEQYPWIFASTGVHPHEAKAATPDSFDELQRLAEHPKVIALGEMGLDYHYNHSPKDTQREVFARQMQIAGEVKLPIIIHCRPSQSENSAWEEAFELIEASFTPTKLGGIIHCFTGEPEHAQRAVELGFMVSFSGAITFPKAENIRQAAAEIPLERILVETDSPFLAPVPNRGKRNEPALVVKVAEKVAEVRGISVQEVAEATSRNFFRLFPLTETLVGPV